MTFTNIILISILPVIAQQQGNQSLEPISPGEEIKVTFTINVFTAGSGDLKLSTSLQNPPQGQYWTLSSQSIYT